MIRGKGRGGDTRRVRRRQVQATVGRAEAGFLARQHVCKVQASASAPLIPPRVESPQY
jgi:hypothetical protein